MHAPPPDETTRKAALTAGFTLIELSVVLVIIGLIVGGILVGRDLIHAAQVRATVTQLERFNTAVNTFKTKFDCIPGVCTTPSQFGLPGAANPNGTLDRWTSTTDAKTYLQDFWGQLQAAGLLQDALPGGYPATHIYGNYYAPGWVSPVCPICQTTSATLVGAGQTIPTGGWTPWDLNEVRTLDCSPLGLYSAAGGQIPHRPYMWDLSVTGGPTGGWGGVLTPPDAAMLDQKIDDGKPLTGVVIAISDYTDSSAACSGNSLYPAISVPMAQCVDSATNSYVFTETGTCSRGGSPANWGVDLLLPAAFAN